MTDREKAIKGLECMWRCLSPINHTCYDCPYQDNLVECRRRVVEDALDLLKTQHEPNILDFSDIQTMKDVDVWCEYRHSENVIPLLLVGCENSNRRQEVYFKPVEVKNLKAYGKTWRCWTSRPDEKRRTETPWMKN